MSNILFDSDVDADIAIKDSFMKLMEIRRVKGGVYGPEAWQGDGVRGIQWDMRRSYLRLKHLCDTSDNAALSDPNVLTAILNQSGDLALYSLMLYTYARAWMLKPLKEVLSDD